MKAMCFGAVLAIFAATACGRSIGDKQEAAAAAQRVASAGQGASSGASPLFLEGLDAGVTINVQGKSGTAAVTLESSAGENGATAIYKIVYENFSPDGENTYDGSITQAIDSSVGTSGVSTSMHLKGLVTMTGEYDSTLDMDIKQVSSVSFGQGGGSISIEFDGYIKADGTQYDYAQEKISIELSGK